MSEFNIDPEFSVYRLVERARQSMPIIQHRRTMSVISHEIEDATLIDYAKTTVFSSFQYMSKFLPQINRYTRLAQVADSVYVFGVPDVELPAIPNITYVPLSEDDQLTKEWFLVSFGERYYSALATEELSKFSDPDPLRQFKGVWTFDYGLVNILKDWLSDTVGLRRLSYDDTMRPDTSSQTHHVLKASERLRQRAARETDPTLRDELMLLVARGLHPVTKHLYAGML